MRRKRIIGVLLIVASLVLAVIVFSEVQKTVILTGLGISGTASYTPPFAYHGPLVVLGCVTAVALLLAGLYLASPDRK